MSERLVYESSSGGHRRVAPASRRRYFESLGYSVLGTEEEIMGDNPGTEELEPEENSPLKELTREELYELAQEEEIEGRSDMSKEELIDALEEVV